LKSESSEAPEAAKIIQLSRRIELGNPFTWLGGTTKTNLSPAGTVMSAPNRSTASNPQIDLWGLAAFENET